MSPDLHSERAWDAGDRLALAAALAASLAFVVALNLTPLFTSDFWLQLRVGQEIRETGSIPRTLVFPFTEARDFAFLAHEWLPSVLNSWLFDRVGYAGMVLVKCGFSLLIFGGMALFAWQLCRNAVVSLAAGCLALLVMNFRIHMRPELYGFTLALLQWNLLEGFLRTGRRSLLWATLPASLVWANAHASFLFNLGFPWLFAAGALLDDLRSRPRRDRAFWRRRGLELYAPLAATGLATLLVTLINPFGAELLTHFASAGQADFLRHNIVEFMPPLGGPLRDAFYVKLYLAFAALVLLSFAFGWRRSRALCVLLVLCFGVLSLRSSRFIAWFGLAGSAALAVNLGHVAATGTARRAAASALALLLGLSAVVVFQRGNVNGMRVGFTDLSPLPAEAIDFIREADLRGNVFNAYDLGDQLVYHFHPQLRVVIDSRSDAYGPRYYRYYRSLSGRNARLLAPPEELTAFLDEHGVDILIVRHLDAYNWKAKGHLAALAARGFRVIYRDRAVLILRRPAGASGARAR